MLDNGAAAIGSTKTNTGKLVKLDSIALKLSVNKLYSISSQVKA